MATFVCLFVCLTILRCKVSMALSGDLVAPLTGLRCSGGLPNRVPTTRKLSSDYSVLRPALEGSGKHGSQTPTGRMTLNNQSLRCRHPILAVELEWGFLPYQRSLMSRGFGSASAVEIATQYIEGSVELALTAIHRELAFTRVSSQY